MLKILICGCRKWSNYDSILAVVKGLIKNYGEVVIVEGECSGADILARQAAIECCVPFRGYPAEWNRYGNAAGPIRNQQMIDEEHPDMCIAFHPFLPGSKGTKDMVNKARQAGIETYIITE
jgi:hypothetical protein